MTVYCTEVAVEVKIENRIAHSCDEHSVLLPTILDYHAAEKERGLEVV